MNPQQLHHLVQRHFIWTPDKEVFGMLEHWTSHAEQVLAGQSFRDDCDGFALTCAEIAAIKGYDLSRIKIIYCKDENGGGHLVASVNGWILDNRQRTARRLWPLSYEWISEMYLDEPGTWRKA